MKDSYSENYKTLKKEIEEVIWMYKDIPHLWINRINMMNIAILLK
jgi:hypothetical protein